VVAAYFENFRSDDSCHDNTESKAATLLACILHASGAICAIFI
jgi:hypothetical protein